MWKRILVGVVVVVVVFLGMAAAGLVRAHQGIRREHAALPDPNLLLAASSEGGPVRVSFINTASQVMPRSAVLEPSLDPRPQEPYVMSHPSFLLEWDDGRLLLVDSGMTREGAVRFGRPIEKLSGGSPIEPLGSITEVLGEARRRVAGAVFTHLHSDHVGGMSRICDDPSPVRVFMTPAQAERPNYTTRGGWKDLREAPCLEITELPETRLAPLPGFPGVYVVAAGGHTPGSEIIIANIRSGETVRRIAFVGDIVNHIDGITYDLPKPRLYSLLVVPEDGERLGELRRWLRELRDRHGIQVLSAHDQLDLERSGIPAWTPSRVGG